MTTPADERRLRRAEADAEAARRLRDLDLESGRVYTREEWAALKLQRAVKTSA